MNDSNSLHVKKSSFSRWCEKMKTALLKIEKSCQVLTSYIGKSHEHCMFYVCIFKWTNLSLISPLGSIMGWLFSFMAVPLMVHTRRLWLQWAEGRLRARLFSCGSQTLNITSHQEVMRKLEQTNRTLRVLLWDARHGKRQRERTRILQGAEAGQAWTYNIQP